MGFERHQVMAVINSLQSSGKVGKGQGPWGVGWGCVLHWGGVGERAGVGVGVAFPGGVCRPCRRW